MCAANVRVGEVELFKPSGALSGHEFWTLDIEKLTLLDLVSLWSDCSYDLVLVLLFRNN